PDLLAGTRPASTHDEARFAAAPRLKSFEQWLGQGSATGFAVFCHPSVLARALGCDLGLPVLAADETTSVASATPGMPVSGVGSVLEADGLEWPLRLAGLWQMVA